MPHLARQLMATAQVDSRILSFLSYGSAISALLADVGTLIRRR
jgi:hypothetical protein